MARRKNPSRLEKTAIKGLGKINPKIFELNEEQRRAIRNYFLWEKYSMEKDFVLGEPTMRYSPGRY